MNIDVSKEIRRAVDTGKVMFGYRSAEKSILKGKGEIVIISKNCPKRLSERIRQVSQTGKIPLFEFDGTGLELGSICGKPFLISTILVLDTGKSKVLEIQTAAKPKAAKAQKKRKPVAKKTPSKPSKKTAKKPKTKKTKTAPKKRR